MKGARPHTPNDWPTAQQLERVASVVHRVTAQRTPTQPVVWRCDPGSVRVTPLRGGLESTTVARVAMCARQDHGRQSVTFVAKRLHDDGLREAAVYDWLAMSRCADLAPRCFAIEPAPDGSRWLFLEALTPVARWPWGQIEYVSAAVHALAELHQAASAAGFQTCVPDLGYEAELTHSSLRTLRVFDAAAATREPSLRSFGPALRRVVDSLPVLRRQVSAAVGLTPAVLHGDVHSRNLLICRRGATTRAVFADWARARCGSPLEDVSSWLHSLGFWEPEARRRHDTLLKCYFEARGRRDAWTRAVRDACWLTSASNALAGALEYNLEVIHCPTATARQRHTAARAAREWLRIIRRADAVWRIRGGGRAGHRDANDRRTTTRLAIPSTETTPPS